MLSNLIVYYTTLVTSIAILCNASWIGKDVSYYTITNDRLTYPGASILKQPWLIPHIGLGY